MTPVIACSTVDGLRWFLERTQTSVVYSSLLALDSTFPAEVRAAVGRMRSAEADLAVATPETLREVTKRDAQHDELLVFAGSQVIGAFTEKPKTREEAVVELVKLFDENHQTAKRQRRIDTVLRLVEAAHATARKHEARSKVAARRDPYEILELTRGATLEDARRARKRLLAQYHPDKVAQLGPKLRDLAEHESKTINAAYDELRASRRAG